MNGSFQRSSHTVPCAEVLCGVVVSVVILPGVSQVPFWECVRVFLACHLELGEPM